MIGELPPDNSSFSLEAQYAAAGWRATFGMFALIGESLADSADQIAGSYTYAKLARLALKDTPEIIDFIESARNIRSPESPGLRNISILGPDAAYSINPDFEKMTMLYYSNNVMARDFYNLSRFDDDIDTLATFRFNEFQLLSDQHGFSPSRYIQRATLGNTIYIGMWDTDRQMSRQQPSQLIQMPQSSAQQQPEQPDRLRASA